MTDKTKLWTTEDVALVAAVRERGMEIPEFEALAEHPMLRPYKIMHRARWVTIANLTKPSPVWRDALRQSLLLAIMSLDDSAFTGNNWRNYCALRAAVSREIQRATAGGMTVEQLWHWEQERDLPYADGDSGAPPVDATAIDNVLLEEIGRFLPEREWQIATLPPEDAVAALSLSRMSVWYQKKRIVAKLQRHFGVVRGYK